MSSSLHAQAPTCTDGRDAPDVVRHRTERDAQGRIWRFVYDPAAQDPLQAPGTVRVRCTTGTARAAMILRDDWMDWSREQLLDQLASALQRQRGSAAPVFPTPAGSDGPSADRRIARRRLVRDESGVSWNCVYDPSAPPEPGDGDRVRVRCAAGRDRLELLLDPTWHRLGDRQIAALLAEGLAARRR